MSKFVRSQIKRIGRFEQTKISSAVSIEEGNTNQVINTSTSSRAADRLSVGSVAGTKFYTGDRGLMFAGGDNDVPTILGKSPYIF